MSKTFYRTILGMVLILSTPAFHAQSRAFLDSLKSALSNEPSADGKCKLYNELSRTYSGVHVDSAMMYAQQGLRLSKQTGADKFRGKLYNAAGIAAISAGNAEASLAYMDSALIVERQRGDQSGIAGSLGNKGSILYMSGRYNESQKLQFEALRIYETLGDQSAIATTLSNIHGTYSIMKDWKNALQSGHRAMAIFRQLNELDGQGFMAFNLASVYTSLGVIDSMEHYGNQTLYFFQKLNSEEGIADGKRVLSDVAVRKKNFIQAEQYAKEAMATYEKMGSQYKYAQILAILAEMELAQEHNEKAIQYAQELLDVAEKMGVLQFKRDAYKYLMTAYGGMQNFSAYYDYAEKYIPLRDSIINEDVLEEVNRLKVEYGAERQAKENELLKQREEILQLELTRKNWWISLSIALSVVLIMLVSFYYRNRKLKQERETLQLEQRLLRAQMNPHFVFNSLSAIQSFLYSKEPILAGKYLSSFANLIRGILDNSKTEWVLLSKEIAWLENYLELQLLRFDQSFDYKIHLDDDMPIDLIKVPPMLVQPFIENSIEHGFKQLERQGLLEVSFHRMGDVLEVTIVDNGHGFDVTDKANTLDSTPHAMSITSDRIQALNQTLSHKITLNVKSEKGVGTTVKFVVPVKSI